MGHAVQYEALAVTATSSGSVTTYSAGTYTGFVHAIRYVSASATTANTPSTGGALAITGERISLAVLSLDDTSTANQGTYYPRSATVTTTGAASTGNAQIPLYNERLVVTITSGSTTATTKTATLYFYIS